MHDGHRQRLKDVFLKQGISNFPDHNILELLLFFTIPRRDTNEIAHNLMDSFGSLSNVFDASFEELIKVDGVGASSATLITLIPQLFRKYSEDKNTNILYFNSPESVGKYLISKFIGVKVEQLLLLSLDNKGSLINCDVISEGTVNVTDVDKRKVVEKAIKNNASSVILSHNHPGGITVPSAADINSTHIMSKTFQTIGVRLLDHVIVAGDEYFSMADCQKYTYMFI